MMDNELITAISAMMDEKLDKKLYPITERLDGMDKRLDGMDKRLDDMDKRLDGMDEHFNTLDAQLAGIKETIDKNYLIVEEFFVKQQEINTAITNKIDFWEEKVDLYANQTIKNTLQLKG